MANPKKNQQNKMAKTPGKSKKKRVRRKCAGLKKCWTNHFNVFNVLADESLPLEQKRAIIMNMSNDQMSSFSKILNDFCFNRSGNILTSRETKKLKADRNFLKTIASNKTSFDTKKKVMAQKGGFLSFLFPLLAAGAGFVGKAIIGSLAKKAAKGLVKGIRKRR